MSAPCRLHVASGALALALVAVACAGRSPITPSPPATCTFALSVTSAQVPAGGVAMTVHVDTAASCAWTVRSASAWIAPNASSGTGPADVVLTVAANEGTAERNSTVTIAHTDLAVRQAGRSIGPCTFSLQSASSTFGPEGGRGRLSVVTGAGCPWTAAAQAGWISLRTASGTGPAEIEYDVAAFDGSPQRETRIVVADASFTVRQDPPVLGACAYSVDPTSTVLHWHGAVGDGFDVRLTTASHCTWTAASGASWIELLTAGAGAGSTTVRTRVGAYTAETTRSAPLMVRWPTATAGQNVIITQEGCRYAVSITSDAVPSAGGRRRVGVFGTPVSVSCSIGCPWTVASNSPWIHVPGVATRAGDDDVFFDVDANATGAERIGTLTIAGFTLTITQAR